MKNNEATFFVFIASIIIGVLISLNISFKDTPASVQLDTKQYQDAINKRNKLYSEISKLKQDNDDISNKINEYNYSYRKNEKILNDILDEVDKNKMMAGISAVKGKGLKIVLADGAEAFQGEIIDADIQRLRIIHDRDMYNVFNELRLAGAQAISINGQRVVFNTAVDCLGQFLRINGVRVPGPFYIEVIGEPETMQATLNRSDGYFKELVNRGISVTVSPEDEVNLPKYSGKIEFRNLTAYIK